MNQVLAELVAAQHRIAAAQGKGLPITDEDLAARMMDYYGMCPICREPLDFKPEVAVALCESREHFITLYGSALRKHHQDRPRWESELEKLAEDPVTQAYICKQEKQFKQGDVKRWLGKESRE
jgi:hypothetical protein